MGRVRENRERFNKVGKDQGVCLIKMERLRDVRGRFMLEKGGRREEQTGSM